MKHLLRGFGLLLLVQATVCADTICHWNFNSPVPDGTSSTGTLAPAVGIGTAQAIGGVGGSFVSGGAADPLGADDTAWSTTDYAWNLRSNKTAGVRFLAGTVGFEHIKVSWSQQNSATASRYMRLQYTLDGITWQDSTPIAVLKESVYTNFTVDLSAISGTTNNPLFGFQLTTEFESTAISGGLPGYIATGAADYDAAGTIKFDMVTISGHTIGDDNTPPYIFAEIGDQVLPANGISVPLPFLVLDAEEAATNLLVQPSSSNPSVLPVGNIVVEGLAAERNVRLQAAGVPGSSAIGLHVIDSGGKSNQFAFNVTVLPANSAPVISSVPPIYTTMGVITAPIPFTVQDGETSAVDLLVNVSAGDPLLAPPGNLVLSGIGTNRFLTITPAPGLSGVTPVTLSASDGENMTSSLFPLVVLPSADLVFYDTFAYPNGAATTNSGYLWTHRLGTYGDCAITNGMLRLSEALSEDIATQFKGAPYEPGTGAVLYLSFKLRSSGLPDKKPATFAHFMTGSTMTGKLSIGTSNAIEGTYRLFVGNGPKELPQDFPMSMNSKIDYQVVLRYNVDTARMTLWVNPASEASPSVTAIDEQTPGRVSTFNFRQHSGIGPELLIDDFRAGLSFAAVTAAPAALPMLLYAPEPGSLRLMWGDPLLDLQCAGDASGPYTNVEGAVSPYNATMRPGNAFYRLRGQ